MLRISPISEDGGVIIEENVWLGANVSVLGGVTVGRGSVAGAGALLSRSVPPYSVCMGVPADVVRKRI